MKWMMAAALLIVAGTAAAQTTYNVDFLINAFPGENELIQGTITTDGQTGPLAASDITSWSLFSVSSEVPFNSSGGPGSVSQVGPGAGALTATASALTFNFAGDESVVFQSGSGTGIALDDIQGAGGNSSLVVINPGNNVSYGIDVLPVSTVVATASAPEIDPASAASGLTLLLGALAVLRGRRAKPIRS